jgi:hypothetical protein
MIALLVVVQPQPVCWQANLASTMKAQRREVDQAKVASSHA